MQQNVVLFVDCYVIQMREYQMDEKTELLAARFPEEIIAWLKVVAEARGWSLSRTLRWAVRETMSREYDRNLKEHHRELDAEISHAGMPPEAP